MYILLCLGIVAAFIKPLGLYMARVYEDEPVWLEGPLGWLEDLIYWLCGINPHVESGWRGYAMAVLALGLLGSLLLFIIFSAQGVLPLNPQGYPGFSPDLAFNAAMAFISNTDWQSYSGEAQMSYLSQMAGCTVQNFLAAATGMAVAVAMFRAFGRKQAETIGNPYVDVVRGILYILLPMALLFAVLLASQGVVQTLSGYVPYQPLEAGFATQGLESEERIAVGPVASQVAIKMLGSSGGGFFNANAAHPYENPTLFSNLLQLISILLIPAALVYTFGVMVKDRRQGWGLLAAMTIIFVPMALLAVEEESGGNPRMLPGIEQSAGNMEGKEVRIGAASSALWAVAATATSNGSVNSMHDSFFPLSGMISLMFIQFGEVVFGGVGTGIHGMFIYVIITVFIGGLMVGRTPEYLGNKLGSLEVKIAALCVIIPEVCVLMGTALALSTEAGRAGILNPGPHGFTEVMYAVSSAGNNNGSAFAGLNANTPFYNILLGVCMAIYRFGLLVLLLLLAGSLAAKNKTPENAGTLPTHTPLFTIMLVVTILLVDVLTYLPAMALGPIVDHLHLHDPTYFELPGTG